MCKLQKVKKPFVFPEKNFSNTKMKNKKIDKQKQDLKTGN